MKPSRRALSKSNLICFRLRALALVAGLSCVFIVSESSVPLHAAPGTSALGSSVAGSSGSGKTYTGIIAHQMTGWGVYDTKACAGGIRIQSQTGAILVAAPPDWTVYVFRKGQKKAAKLPYATFLTKNRFSVRLSAIRERPRATRIAGVNAIFYSFNINKRLDETTSLSSLYRTQQTHPFIERKEIAFPANSYDLPIQAKEIWRSYFESPVVAEIPLETTLYMLGGEKRMHMETKSFKRGPMSAAEFKPPSGLNFSGQFVEMIYGKEMEGLSDLLMEP